MSHLAVKTVRPSVQSVERAVRKQARKNSLLMAEFIPTVYTRCAWAGGTFFPVVLLYYVSIWYWREIGFALIYYVLMYLEYNTVVVLC
jgi:hypothetical protein